MIFPRAPEIRVFLHVSQFCVLSHKIPSSKHDANQVSFYGSPVTFNMNQLLISKLRTCQIVLGFKTEHLSLK